MIESKKNNNNNIIVIEIKIPKSWIEEEIKEYKVKRRETWRWLLTCEMVSPFTSISWRTSLGVASINPTTKRLVSFKIIRSNRPNQTKKLKKREREQQKRTKQNEKRKKRLTVLTTKPVDGMNKTVMKLRSPSQTRNLWSYVLSHCTTTPSTTPHLHGKQFSLPTKTSSCFPFDIHTSKKQVSPFYLPPSPFNLFWNCVW